jgi:hypothetical protein
MKAHTQRLLLAMMLLIATGSAFAQEDVPATPEQPDTVVVRPKPDLMHRIGNFFTRYFKDFNETDTSYIEPQHYNYAFMMQNTNTYETYRLRSKSGQSINFAPKPTYRIGPFFGWRWIFLGYTFDISHITNTSNKKEFDISLYSNLMCVDLYYRKTGTDYLIRQIDFNDGAGKRKLHGVAFDGLNVGITGVNLHYIFNHKRFSYPAAFSQSTVQRRSCGSALAGFGYTRHSISLDHERLQEVVGKAMVNDADGKQEAKIDSGLMFRQVRYTDLSMSGGYAYNWVFAHNWLFAASLSLAVGYKRATGDLRKDELTILHDFSFKNVVLDGTGRLGIVWNNTKWFAGMSTIVHSYSFRKHQFSTNNNFGYLNFYVGFNFNRKKGH